MEFISSGYNNETPFDDDVTSYMFKTVVKYNRLKNISDKFCCEEIKGWNNNKFD